MVDSGDPTDEYICRRVESEDEIRKALLLVQKKYIESGYIDASIEGNFEQGLFRYAFLPSAETFVVMQNDVVFGTVTVITDSPDGIPMESLYTDEITALRKNGYLLAEVSQLATLDEGDARIRTEKVVFPLFRAVLRFAFEKEIDVFVVAVNPKHAAFYDSIGFETIGETKEYASVSGAPAIPKKLLLSAIREQKDSGKLNFVMREILKSL